MPAPATACPAAASFERPPTPPSSLNVDPRALDQVMADAYQLYQAGRYAEVDILCRGLIAADPAYWWSYSLHAAALCRLGRLAKALEQVERGLAFEPNAKKLRLMRGEILAVLDSWSESATAVEPGPAVPGPVAASDASSGRDSTSRARG
jgi:predicted Zn-dependent protease